MICAPVVTLLVKWCLGIVARLQSNIWITMAFRGIKNLLSKCLCWVFYTILILSIWLGTARMEIKGFWFMNLCQWEAWKTIFLVSHLGFVDLQICHFHTLHFCFNWIGYEIWNRISRRILGKIIHCCNIMLIFTYIAHFIERVLDYFWVLHMSLTPFEFGHLFNYNNISFARRDKIFERLCYMVHVPCYTLEFLYILDFFILHIHSCWHPPLWSSMSILNFYISHR